MRKLVITQNITLDGSIELLGDWFDPAAGDDDVLAATNRLSARCDAILLGRCTFEDLRGYWPEQTDDETGISAELDGLQKYVVSSTLGDPGWRGSTVVRGDWRSAVRDLKASAGREISVTGSIRLCHDLIREGLVDEYRLFVYPVVQGRGRRLFPDDGREWPVRLVELERFEGGVVLATYRPAARG